VFSDFSNRQLKKNFTITAKVFKCFWKKLAKIYFASVFLSHLLIKFYLKIFALIIAMFILFMDNIFPLIMGQNIVLVERENN